MTYTDSLYFMRQLDIVDPSKLPSTCIIGCGGVGSTVAIYLAKMGVTSFLLYDHDEIRHHNLSNQMFPNDSIGKYKVEVVRDEIGRYSPMPRGLSVTTMIEAFTKESSLDDTEIVISALDNMESRRDVWEVVRSEFPTLYIDTRMGGEVAKVYALNPFDGSAVRFYEDSLKQGHYPIPCTAQAIAYNVGLIAAMVGSIVRRSISEMEIPRLIIGDSLNWEIIKF